MKKSTKTRKKAQVNSKWSGIIVVLILVLGLVLLLQVWQNQRLHEDAAKTYITDELIPNLSLWQTRYWYKHLSPEARKGVTTKYLRQTLKQYAQLGRLQSQKSLTFSNRAKNGSTGPGQLYNYIVHAQYDNDSAVLQLTLRKAEKIFYLERINIISMVFDKTGTKRIEIRLPKKDINKKSKSI